MIYIYIYIYAYTLHTCIYIYTYLYRSLGRSPPPYHLLLRAGIHFYICTYINVCWECIYRQYYIYIYHAFNIALLTVRTDPGPRPTGPGPGPQMLSSRNSYNMKRNINERKPPTPRFNTGFTRISICTKQLK